MTPSPVLVVFAISFIAVVLGADVTVTTSDGDESGVNDVSKVRAGGGEGMEEEVLGPLRIWHIVFLVALVVLIAVTVVCCCVECRIPRTRQEIEEAYRQRQMNRKYLRQLERTPETILSRTDTETTDDQNEESSDHDHDHDRVVRKHPPQTQPHPGQQNQRHNNNIATTSHQRHDTGQEPRQQRHHHHNNHPHHHHQQRQQTHSQQQADATANVGVAVTESSARLSRLPKSQMFGVHTPFSLGAITAMQKQKQSQRQQQQQT